MDITNKLRNAKTDDLKKRLCRMMAYAIDNRNDYEKLLRYVHSWVKNNSGYTRDYYRNHPKGIKRKKLMNDKKKTSPEHRKRCRDDQNRIRMVYYMYEKGQLSDTSSDRISKKLSKIKR